MKRLAYDSQKSASCNFRCSLRGLDWTSLNSQSWQLSHVSFHSLRSGRNTLSAYHSQRLAQAVEDMIGTDDVGQAMAVQIGLKGRLRVCEHQHNAVAGQVFV